MSIPFYEYHVNLINGLSLPCLDYPVHLHGQAELVRVKKGTLKMLIYNQEYILEAGDLAVVFPNVIHSFETLTEAADTWIETLVCGEDPNNGFPGNLIGCYLKEPVMQMKNLHPDVDYMFSALLRELWSPFNTRIINHYFQILWLRLLPKLAITRIVQPVDSDLMANLIRYIGEHFCEPLSLESVSREFGVCRFYLSRVFSKVLHIRFCDYLNTLRVNKAKHLLGDSKENILDVAMLCGFSSQQTFNRVFKEITGSTPSEFRKNRGKV